jgi:hypothetical protein
MTTRVNLTTSSYTPSYSKGKSVKISNFYSKWTNLNNWVSSLSLTNNLSH